MSTIQDIDVTLGDIVALNKRYSNRLDHFELIRMPKKSDMDELICIALDFQNVFIMKKQLCRSLIQLLPKDLQNTYEIKLANLQTEYRVCVTRKKEYVGRCDRTLLFSVELPAAQPKTNNDYLNHAKIIEEKNVVELKKGLRTIGETVSVAINIGTQLTEDREKIERINQGLDKVESELSIARKRITIFGKKLATDKVLILFGILLVLGIVGIIIYATLNPGQKTFNVPQ